MWHGISYSLRYIAMHHPKEKPYMISHFVGNPHGPSLSFSFFSCGPSVFGAALAPDPLAGVVLLFSVVVVVSAATAFFSSCWPSSHGNALATVS